MSFISQALVLAFGFGFLVPSAYAQSQFPPIAVWEVGQFSASPNPSVSNFRFCQFTSGAFVQYQTNADTTVFTAEETLLFSTGVGTNTLVPPQSLVACIEPGNSCLLEFQPDGNLVSSYNGKVLWTAGTEGRGMWLVCQETAPWLYIVDGAGTEIWSTSSPPT